MNRRLHAGRLKLARSMDLELRARALESLNAIAGRTAKRYEQTAHLEEDEVFLLTIDDLPRRGRIKSRPSPSGVDGEDEQVEASALFALLSTPGALEPLDADDVRGRSFLFYAVVFTDTNGNNAIAFIKRHNSASILRAGLLLGQFGQTVTKIDQPVLVFAHDFDLVIDHDEIAALGPDAVSRLFADVEVVAAAIPALVHQLGQHQQLRLSGDSRDAIARACGRRRLLGRRLQQLLGQPHLSKLTPANVRTYLETTKQDPSRFVQDNRLVCSESDVDDFLDVLNQAHYLGGYDSLLRRADRFSLIKPRHQ